MDEAARAEAIAALDAFLRRPGEIFTDEWEGYAPKHNPPPIGQFWMVGAPDERVNAHLETSDNSARAWDRIRDEPDFNDWYLAHESALRGPPERDNDVVFEERATRRMRVSHKGNLVFRVPYTDVWGSADEVAALREIIQLVLTRRAQAEGISPPPTP